jgi:RNA polymerase-binding transcription factor
MTVSCCQGAREPLSYAAFCGGLPPELGVEKPVSTTVSKQLNKKELKRFHEMLVEKRRAVLERARKTLSEDMTLDPNDLPDEMDLASSEYIQSFEFRMRGREKFLLKKIDLALKKIDDGVFGVCEMCEEPIGKKRLEARPETSMCIRCKEDQERDERTFG